MWYNALKISFHLFAEKSVFFSSFFCNIFTLRPPISMDIKTCLVKRNTSLTTSRKVVTENCPAAIPCKKEAVPQDIHAGRPFR